MIRRFLPVLLLFVFAIPASAQEYPWQLKKDEDGIRVYTRKVENSSILEFRSEMTVNVPQEKAAAFYENIVHYPEWMDGCEEAKLLEDGEDGKIVYFVLGMPWPVKNRDVVYRRVKSVEADDIFYRLSALSGVHPEESGRIRIRYLKVEWRFHKLEDGRTEIRFQQHSDTGGHIPAAVVNALSVNIPFKSFKSLRKLLEK